MAPSQLFTAVLHCNLAEVKRILQSEKLPVDFRSDDGDTALIASSYFGHMDIVQFLLSEGADVDAVDNQRMTSLMKAAVQDRHQVADLLVQNEADIDKKGYKGFTALMIAAGCGAEKTVHLLVVKGAKLCLRDDDNWTATDHAVMCGYQQIEQLLTQAGATASPGVSRPRYGQSDGSKQPNVFASLSTDMTTDLSSRVFDDVTTIVAPASRDKLPVLKSHQTSLTDVSTDALTSSKTKLPVDPNDPDGKVSLRTSSLSDLEASDHDTDTFRLASQQVTSSKLHQTQTEQVTSSKLHQTLTEQVTSSPALKRQRDERKPSVTTDIRDTPEFLAGLEEEIAAEPDVEYDICMGKTIRYNDKNYLGSGCDGTRVFRGTLHDSLSKKPREVAIKRMLRDRRKLAAKEKDLLLSLPPHPNVIQYLDAVVPESGMFLYLVLELCTTTLHQCATGEYDVKDFPRLDVLRQTVEGVRHLHNLNPPIIHRDIKPRNILMHLTNGQWVAKISDFDRSKQLEEGRHSATMSGGGGGTEGWRSLEMIEIYNKKSQAKLTCASDVFSLGCVIYFVMSKGNHPFGEYTLERDVNIQKQQAPEFKHMGKDCESLLTYDLVKDMVSHDHALRPATQDVARHPLFWENTKQLDFIRAVKRFVKSSKREKLSSELEKNAHRVLNGNWMNNVSPSLKTDLQSRTSYNGLFVCDLILAVRNKVEHLCEESTSPELREELGGSPESCWQYFLSRFPRLLLHTYIAVLNSVSEQEEFTQFY